LPDLKRVGVTMTARDYRVLKLYAARYDMTMGDVLKEYARAGIHKHTKICHSVEAILASEGLTLDSRLDKPCWGELCMCCVHREDCANHEYSGVFEFNVERFGSWEAVGKGDLPVFE
jgi:hypothetical protein